MKFDRNIYFANVRVPLFGGKLTQQQVDGQEAILSAVESSRPSYDLRWLAYELATTKHETSSTMWPIEEAGKGKGHPYGEKNPVTGEAYYGRGFVQLTWAENYKAMTPLVAAASHKDVDLFWHPEQALDLQNASIIMFEGMEQGLFRPPNNLALYFNTAREDPYAARNIINGDASVIPSWSRVSIGRLIASYYSNFLSALHASLVASAQDDVVSLVTLTLTVRSKSKITVDDVKVSVVEALDTRSARG